MRCWSILINSRSCLVAVKYGPLSLEPLDRRACVDSLLDEGAGDAAVVVSSVVCAVLDTYEASEVAYCPETTAAAAC